MSPLEKEQIYKDFMAGLKMHEIRKKYKTSQSMIEPILVKYGCKLKITGSAAKKIEIIKKLTKKKMTIGKMRSETGFSNATINKYVNTFNPNYFKEVEIDGRVFSSLKSKSLFHERNQKRKDMFLMRLGGDSYKKIGEKYNLTKQRAEQILHSLCSNKIIMDYIIKCQKVYPFEDYVKELYFAKEDEIKRWEDLTGEKAIKL